jgi:cytochrome c peroxidase
MRPKPVTAKLVIAVLFVAAGVFVCLAPFRERAAQASPASRFGSRMRVPRGLSESRWRSLIPADNPLTDEKVALGEALYFDKRLSADGTVSCATCHDPAEAFADRKATAVGIEGRRGARNAPTLLNVMFSAELFWDGRARSLEEQAKLPLVNPDEMGMPNHEEVVARVASAPEYRAAFRKAFGRRGVTIDLIVKAIAAYERTCLTGDSPFDRFVGGDAGALNASQKRGWELFRHKAGCINCHTFGPDAPFFTDFKFHNTGVASGVAGAAADLGRFRVTGRLEDAGAFKTPTLRNVELTSPYMHDGSEKTLIDVVRFYSKGGVPNPQLDSRLHPLSLTEDEISDLVGFLRALTGDGDLRRVQNSTPQDRSPVFNLPR